MESSKNTSKKNQTKHKILHWNNVLVKLGGIQRRDK